MKQAIQIRFDKCYDLQEVEEITETQSRTVGNIGFDKSYCAWICEKTPISPAGAPSWVGTERVAPGL